MNAAVDMPELDTAPVDASDRLSFTLFVAIAIHALVILGINFKLPNFTKGSETIEVTLATHKAAKAPKEADFIAQHNQEASGTEAKAKQLTTERHAEFADTQVRNVNPTHQVSAASPNDKKEQQIVTTTGASNLKTELLKNPDQREEKQKREGLLEDQTAVTAEIASLQAKLDKQRQEYAKRPRIRTLTSVSAKESFDAEYLIKWSEKFETIGNKNFPREALNERITGKVLLSIMIKPDGSVENVAIHMSSGKRILDDYARQVVRLGAPYAPFPPELRQRADRLEIIRHVNFTVVGLNVSEE